MTVIKEFVSIFSKPSKIKLGTADEVLTLYRMVVGSIGVGVLTSSQTRL